MVCRLTSARSQALRNRWWYRLAIAIALLLSVPFAAGCSLLNGATGSGPMTGPNPHHLELTSLRVGGIAATSSAALYIALARGYFTQEGLTVTPVTTAGGATAIPKMLSGGLDITLTNYVQAIDGQVTHAADKAGGIKIVTDGVAATPRSFPFDVLPSSGLTTMQDLRGRTVSVSSPGDIVTLALDNLLQANAIPLNAIHFVTVPFANTPQVLASGQVDAAVQTDPYTTKSLKQSGVRMLVDPFATDGPNAGMAIAGYVTTGDFAAKAPKTIAAFQRAMARTVTDTNDRATVERIIPTYISTIDQDTADLMVLPQYFAEPNPTRLQRVVSLMAKFHQLSDPTFQISSMILPLPGT